MKKHLFLCVLLLTIFFSWGQQLKNWPIYCQNSGVKGLANFSYTTGPTYSYTPMVYPTIPSTPVNVKILCSNAYHDNGGNLIFYVVQTSEQGSGPQCSKLYKTYFYDANGNQLANCAPFPTCASASYTFAPATTEINIVPLPSCGENSFHIIIGNHLVVLDMRINSGTGTHKGIVHQSPIITESGINNLLNPGTQVYSAQTPTAVWVRDRSSYFVYFLAANTGAFTHARLYKIQVSLNLCEKRNCNTTGGSNPDPTPYEIQTTAMNIGGATVEIAPFSAGFNGAMVSELELSDDGKHLLFNDAAAIISLNFKDPDNPDLIASLDTNACDTFLIPRNQHNSPFMISGLEYSTNNDYIYYTIFDEYHAPGPLYQDALIQQEIAWPHARYYFPSSARFARSQLEKGIDGNVYMMCLNDIGYIDSPYSLNTLPVTPAFSPGNRILINPSPVNTGSGSDYSIYSLPDQLDGQLFDYSYFNNSRIDTHYISFCLFDGDVLRLRPTTIGCSGDDNEVDWYEVTPSGFVYRATDPEYVVTSSRVDAGTLVIEASYIDEFMCIKRERFVISRPDYATEIINVSACYNSTVNLIRSCADAPKWYAGELADPYNNTITPLPDPVGLYLNVPGVTHNVSYTAVCRDAGGCVIKKTIYRIQVSPPPVLHDTTIYVCDGEVINMSFFRSPYCFNTEAAPIFVASVGTNVYEIPCKDANGCTVYIERVHVVATPHIEKDTTIYITCGSLFFPDMYTCAYEGNVEWQYVSDNNPELIQQVSGYIVISASGTFTSHSSNPCCTSILRVVVTPQDPIFVNAEVCEGDPVDPAVYIPDEHCRNQHISGVMIATTSASYQYTCTSIIGCTESYIINLQVNIRDIRENQISIPCDQLFLDLSPFNCNQDNPVENQWYIEDPVTHAITPTSSFLFAPNTSTLFHCKSSNPCCSLRLFVEVIHPAVLVPITACEGDLINFGAHLPLDCQVDQLTLATTSQSYIIDCASNNGCITRYTFDVTVTPRITEETEILYFPCGTPVSLNDYACNTYTEWFLVNPATQQPEPVPGPGPDFTITQQVTYIRKCSDPCRTKTIIFSPTQPGQLPDVNLTLCEGEPVLLGEHVWADCWYNNYPAPIIPQAGTYSLVCYDANGCITGYKNVHITLETKHEVELTDTLPCSRFIEFAEYDAQLPCGPVTWYTYEYGEPVPVQLPFLASGNMTLHASSSSGCCIVTLNLVVLPEPEPIVYDICYIETPIPMLCPPGTHAVWTKDGAPYPGPVFSTPNAQYRIQCIDDITGCLKKDIIFNVGSVSCPVTFQCFEEGMSFSSTCSHGTPVWTKNGVPYPADASGTIVPDGPGNYALTCLDKDGIILTQSFFIVLPCDDEDSQPQDFGIRSALKETGANRSTAFKLYPNPTNNMVTLEMNALYQGVIEVTDVLGRIVYTRTIAETERTLQIDCSEWTSSIYFVKAYSGNKLLKTEKLVKVK